MQAALIAMTILGCNDSVSQCQYVDTPPQRWVTLDMCNGDTEKVLARYSNVHFPSVVAFCQKPDTANAALPEPKMPETTPKPLAEAEKQSMARRAIAAISDALPGKADIRLVFETPVHVVNDTYVWAVKKLKNKPEN